MDSIDDITSEQSALKGGFWISDDRDFLYIPGSGGHVPLVALYRYYTHMVLHDTEANQWVKDNLPTYKHSENKWEFWEVYATFLILRRWHLVFEGTIITRLDPCEISRIIRRIPEVINDLSWPQESIVEYRHVEKEPGEEIDYAWGYFCDSAMQSHVDGPTDVQPDF